MRVSSGTLSLLSAILGAFGAITVEAATFRVSTTSDTGASDCATPASRCTLRDAIITANASVLADRIEFDVAGVIAPLSALPTITERVIIDGESAPGYVSPGPPLVTLDGIVAGGAADGLRFGSGAAISDVLALAIVNFSGSGIETVGTADALLVQDCYIGIRADGTAAGNGVGISLGTDANLIGADDHGNTISENSGNGISIVGANNLIRSNIIGRQVSLTANGNGGDGVSVSGNGNTVGGEFFAAGNTINDNGGRGVFVFGNDNLVQGNSIGSAGGGVLGNAGDGIQVFGSGNLIGGSGFNQGNLIAGNQLGIRLGDVFGANNNQVIGNNVGIFDSTNGGNESHGILLANGSGNQVSANRVVGNGRGGSGDGIRIDSDGNFVFGNNVGIGPAGIATTDGNTDAGIRILGNSNAIGTDAAFTVIPNVIGLNGDSGIVVGGDGNDIRGNLIGTDSVNADLANGAHGIDILGPAVATNLTIRENTIGNNLLNGVNASADADDVRICGNSVGVAASGGVDIGNNGSGLFLTGDNAQIGPISSCGPNTIGFNAQDGINLAGSANLIAENWIGTDADGLDLGNGRDGIRLERPRSTLNSITDNTIAFNGGSGVGMRSDVGIQNRVSTNSFFNNVGLGIDLANNGVTNNDAGDADTGPNQQQNFPALGNISIGGGELQVDFLVDSTTTDATYPIEVDFYLADDISSGEGRRFLEGRGYPAASATAQVTATAIGLPAGTVGGVLVAQATDADSNSSEFSAGRVFGQIDLIFADGFESP